MNGLALAILLAASDLAALPPSFTIGAVQRVVGACGVRMQGETPTVFPGEHGAGNGQYFGVGGWVTERGGSRAAQVIVQVHKTAGRISTVEFNAPDRARFDRCARPLAALAFPHWPGRDAWIDAALTAPASGLTGLGPDQQAGQDGRFLVVRGTSLKIVSPAFDGGSRTGELERGPHTVVPRAAL